MMDAAAILYGAPPSQEGAGTALTAGAIPEPAAAGNPPAASPADVLYGDTSESSALAQADKQTKPTTPEQAAEDLYGEEEAVAMPDLPDDIKALREADQERKLYSAQGVFKYVVPDQLFEDENGLSDLPPEMTPAVKSAAIAEVREICCDLGMRAQDASNFRALGASIKEAPTDEQRVAWREQAVEDLNREYGQDAKQALRDAARFAQRDPRLAKALEHNARGDHPGVVLMLARLARQARARGQFK